MGGRGAGTGGGATGGVGAGNVLSTTSLISQRETKRSEVDDTLTVLRDIEDQYGVILNDVQVATMDAKAAGVMAYYDDKGNLAVTEGYFDSDTMNKAYDRCIATSFHPPRGSKTGMEATVAHECGHKLTDVAGEKLGYGTWKIDKAANKIVGDASRKLKQPTWRTREKISGYAAKSNAEAVAEAFSEVYCMGSKARKESRAIVDVLNGILGS